MGSNLAKENSHLSGMTRKTSRRRMEESHHHPKGLFAIMQWTWAFEDRVSKLFKRKG